jgi:hypothetical protein
MSTEAKIVGYCRACGKALDAASVRAAQGTIFCEEHVPAALVEPVPDPAPPHATSSGAASPAATADAAPPYTSSAYTTPAYTNSPYSGPPPLPGSDVSPGLAFVLGFIPGVGAIYNGQYVKGLIHALITGSIISIMNSGGREVEPVMSFLLVGFWIYMPFEALHTAKQRRAGQGVDEFSSLLPARHGNSRIPIAPVVLIALGVLFLLNNLGLLDLHRLARYWPVLLIALGIYMLYGRLSASSHGGSGSSRGSKP